MKPIPVAALMIALLCTYPLSGAAAEHAPAYVVTSTSETASGAVVTREALSFDTQHGQFVIHVSDLRGTVITAPAARNARGQVAIDAPYRSVTCYNMAIAVVAQHNEPTGGPVSVLVSVAGTAVPVALTVRTAGSGARAAAELIADGNSTGIYHAGEQAIPAGVIVNAVVHQSNGELENAVFSETNYVGSVDQIVARATCSMQRAHQVPAVVAPVQSTSLL